MHLLSYMKKIKLVLCICGLCSLSAFFLAPAPAIHASPTFPLGEAQHAHIEVTNFTAYPMRITGSDLSWGKWGQSPTDVKVFHTISFDSMGRAWSPSGTEGWATWKLEGYPGEPTVTVKWSDPYDGTNSTNISPLSDPSAPFCMINSNPTPGGSEWTVTFSIAPQGGCS